MPKSGYDIELDVVAPRNRCVHFYPMHANLRGAVRMSEIASDRPNGALLQIRGMEIPGMRMLIDMQGMHVKVIDKMTLPENRDRDQALRRLTKQDKYSMFSFTDYEKDVDNAVTAAEWPTWLYHIRRLVDEGRLSIVSGGSKLPTLDEILKMCPADGRIKVQLGSSFSLRPLDPSKPWFQADERDASTVDTVGSVQ